VTGSECESEEDDTDRPPTILDPVTGQLVANVCKIQVIKESAEQFRESGVYRQAENCIDDPPSANVLNVATVA